MMPRVRTQLLDEFNIEIAGGLGPLKGKIWRVGLMGHCSQKPNVLLFLAALEKFCWRWDSVLRKAREWRRRFGIIRRWRRRQRLHVKYCVKIVKFSD